MKTRFEKLSALAKGSAALANRKLSSAQDAVSKAGASALAAGKTARQAMEFAAETSGELLRDAMDHEVTKSTVIKAKEIVTAATIEARKLTVRVVEATKGAENIIRSSESESTKDIENAILKLKGRDKLGRAGEIFGTTGGIAAGASAAGAIASAAGASTLLGSTTLGSVLGGVFVTATPVGWVVGSAALAGAAGYGIAKMIRSGSQQDKIRDELIERLRKRLGSIRGNQSEMVALEELRLMLPATIKGGFVTEEQAERMIGLVEQGTLSAAIALSRVKAISSAKSA